jgi:hypothetical protein
MQRALSLVRSSLRPECWQEWKGPDYGSEGGRPVGWAQEHVAEWLARLDPEVALVMFGTNDLPSLAPDEYRARLRSVVQACLEHGTVVILSTIPPRHGWEEKAAAFAAVARELAGELRLPLVDFHAELLRRRPADWDGALDRFQRYDGYEVPTLLARDGVHPSYPTRYQNDYSPEALRSSGYTLRNYLVLMKYAEVLRALSEPSPGPLPSLAPDSPPLPTAPLVSARRGGGPPPPPPAAPPGTRAAGGSARHGGDPPATSDAAALRPPDRPWFPQAPPLPPATGEVIRVSTVDELFAAAQRVQPGGTLLLADYTRDCRILHNTVHDPDSRLGRLIRLVHDNDGLLVANNLLSGPPLRNESPSRIQLRSNLARDMTTAFVDPGAGNLRLTAKAAAAIERAEPLPDVPEDIDRALRGPRPAIGAHEFHPAGRS